MRLRWSFRATTRCAVLAVATCLAAHAPARPAPLPGAGPEPRALYPTSRGGREWRLSDAGAPDEAFTPATPLSIAARGPPTVYATQGTGPRAEVRLDVRSPAGAPWWRNVELTGYFRYLRTVGDGDAHLELQVRGERHSARRCTRRQVNGGAGPPAGTVTWPWWDAVGDDEPLNPAALGTAYHANLYVTHGDDPAWALFEKELSHPNGYAGQRGRVESPSRLPPPGAWFGVKFVARNDAAGGRVKLELWLDARARGAWVKVSEVVDEHGAGRDWVAAALDGTDAAPYAIAPNQLITWAAPWVTFRSDGLALELRGLSVREVEPLH